MNNFTKPFKNLSKNDTNIAGGKGASLGEMINSGITVPDGFVVLSSTFDEFIEQTDLIQEIEAILDSVDHKVIHTVDKASDKIRELIISREIPEGIKNEIMQSFEILGANFVAVRSSATAEDGADNAWAGQLESYLNVTEKDVLEKVKKCWSSLFTARAIFYRFEKDLQLTKISVAVVVQKMINSEKSGIAFTVHPVTEDRNQMIIEAGYGLGEAIVSGSVTPDSYVISKEPYKIVDLNIGYQDKALFRSKEGENEWIDLSEEKAKSQVLSEEEIYKLGEIILEIENHYGFPCDIEWAFEKGNFYIVQSRPITTLKNKSAKRKIELEKVFSRDKSLMYMFMWNITDGAGFKKFINFEAKNTFFIFDSKIKKTYVWYDLTERKEISRILNNSISSDKYFSKKIIETLDKNWKIVSPFLAGKVEIKTKEEIKLYYEGITNWWSAMNTVYPLINAPSASKKELDLFLKYREKTEKYTGKMDELLMDFFIKNLPKHKDMVEYLTFTEAIDLIDKKNSRLISEVKKRKEGFFICHGIVYPQDKMEEILNKNNLLLKEKIEISENVIKGVVAFCGKTSGLVRKVIKKEDISNFKKGEILVAETTYPDHVPIMQKAAAFVTDEGGITCHAAIVARELRKPCIIGTKIATQVLKDGDLVEVDADNGVVRILERKDKNLIDSRKTATLVKYFSRDHSLFYIYLWRASNCEKAIDWLDKNWHEVLYVRPQGQEEVDVWYSDKEMDQYRRDIESHIKNDPNWFPLITNYFEERWNQIFKFIKKNPQTHDEFKKFTSLWLEWWEPMAIMMQAPEATSLPKELSKHAFDLRAKTQEYSDQADVIYKKYIQHAHPELAKYHSVLLPQEVIDDKFPDSTVLEERLGGWFLTDDTFDPVSCLDETLKEKKLILHKDIHDDSNNLSGQTAYQGIIRGTAKIVKKQSDLDKVLVGDILISPMTTPDFIPAMQKAAAFVTDEGGITCHAAIVARELRKPCIIGTKIATQVLKDGDFVEVDADNGVIKIIK